MTSGKNQPVSLMSRRKQKLLFALGLLALALLSVLDRFYYYHKSGVYSQADAEKVTALDIEKYHARTFSVVYVVDGDTIDIDVPDRQDEHTRIRLWGVDTPETKSEEFGVMYFGPEAYEFTKASVLGKEVCIYLDQKRDTRDNYGRLLAYVKLPDESVLNESLLSEGFAYADLRFRHDFYNKYKQFEAAARNSEKGLWKNVTPEQMPQWLQQWQD